MDKIKPLHNTITGGLELEFLYLLFGILLPFCWQLWFRNLHYKGANNG